MKKYFILWFVLLLLFCGFILAEAKPSVISAPNPQLTEDSIFQVEIDGKVIGTEVARTAIEESKAGTKYPVKNLAVYLDVQNFEGEKSMYFRFGNPWPDLEETYRWSEWSVPFVRAFPQKPGAPEEMRVSSE